MRSNQFEETQQFRQKGLLVIYFLLFALLALFLYGTLQQIVLHKPFGSKPAPSVFLVVAALFLLIMIILFYKTTLETTINNEGVFFRWRPFQKSYTQFSWNNIDKVEMMNYGFVGYGLRLTPYGTVHNVAGNKGIRLILKSRRKVILGTQKPEALESFLKEINKL